MGIVAVQNRRTTSTKAGLGADLVLTASVAPRLQLWQLWSTHIGLFLVYLPKHGDFPWKMIVAIVEFENDYFPLCKRLPEATVPVVLVQILEFPKLLNTLQL